MNVLRFFYGHWMLDTGHWTLDTGHWMGTYDILGT